MCSVISVTRRLLLLVLVLLPDERDELEELREARIGVARRGLHRHAGELLDVLDPTLRLDRALGLELEEVAGLLRGELDHARRAHARRRSAPASAAITWLKPATAPFARVLRTRDLVDAAARLDDVDPLVARERLERGRPWRRRCRASACSPRAGTRSRPAG